jgi:hypothetical protein
MVDQMGLTHFYWVFHLASEKYIFFLAAYGTFSNVDHILGHKASISSYKKVKITSIFHWPQWNKTRTQ